MRTYHINRTIIPMGKDHVILVSGGQAHIGTQVCAIPYFNNDQWHVTLHIWNQIAHRDDEVAKRYASALALHTHHTAICICGIHYDDIQKDEIKEILTWCDQDIEQMKKEVCI